MNNGLYPRGPRKSSLWVCACLGVGVQPLCVIWHLTVPLCHVLQLLDLCDSVKNDALRVTSAFNIPHTFLHAPVAGISNLLAAWAFYPEPPQPRAREGARSPRAKPGAKL